EEKTEFAVPLTSAGEKKINVSKVVREVTNLGLKEAKDVVDGAPKVVKEGVSKEEAATIKKKFEEVGATVGIKERRPPGRLWVGQVSSFDSLQTPGGGVPAGVSPFEGVNQMYT